jgi:hypothetical protein
LKWLRDGVYIKLDRVGKNYIFGFVVLGVDPKSLSRCRNAPGRKGDMTAETRARIAYVAGRIIGQGVPDGVYDRDRGRFLTAGEELDIPNVLKHDPQKTCTVKRVPGADNFCLVDGRDYHVCLSIHGRLFDGFDHRTQSHFSGHVLGRNVSVFDYRMSDYFSFII